MPDDALAHSWPRIRSELQGAVSDTTWHVWLEPLVARGLHGRTLVIQAPDDQRDWISDRFGRLLQACSAAVLGPDVTIDVVGSEPAGLPIPLSPSAVARRSRHADAPAVGDPAPAAASLQLNPRFTFEQFVIGASNRLAHGAALAVAEHPSLAYNPLYICGAPGLGKTHLLHSIASYITAFGEGLQVRYTTAEAFTNHFLAALHGRRLDAFKAAYRDVDVLLVDDVQFLQAKVQTEQEFFHTFNALQTAEAQIVLTSDRLPKDLDQLEDRLRERFASGLVCDIQPPDAPMRGTILRKRVAQDGLDGVHDDAIDAIAERVTANVRALQGALIRVVALGSLKGRPIDAPLAREMLDGLYPLRAAKAPPTVREIQDRTCEIFRVSRDELLSDSRATGVAWPRQVAMYLARELTEESLPSIGSAFGGRRHTTVMHACKRTAERMAADHDAFDAIRRLTDLLGGPTSATGDGDRQA